MLFDGACLGTQSCDVLMRSADDGFHCAAFPDNRNVGHVLWAAIISAAMAFPVKVPLTPFCLFLLSPSPCRSLDALSAAFIHFADVRLPDRKLAPAVTPCTERIPPHKVGMALLFKIGGSVILPNLWRRPSPLDAAKLAVRTQREKLTRGVERARAFAGRPGKPQVPPSPRQPPPPSANHFSAPFRTLAPSKPPLASPSLPLPC